MPHAFHRIQWLSVCVVAASTSVTLAQSRPAVPATQPVYTYREDHDPNGIGKFYMGREIAHVMGHQGAGWLERPQREKEEHPEKLMKALKLRQGDVVADIGVGTGYHTRRMAPLVGENGRIKAVDIQPEMLELLKKNLKEEKITNVDMVLGKVDDPKLDESSCDLVLMVDVYHEFDYPYEMMERISAALKPGGRVVFVEFRMEDPDVPIKKVHKMSEAQVIKEMRPFPLRHKETVDTLPWQHVIIFEKLSPESRPAERRHANPESEKEDVREESPSVEEK